MTHRDNKKKQQHNTQAKKLNEYGKIKNKIDSHMHNSVFVRGVLPYSDQFK